MHHHVSSTTNDYTNGSSHQRPDDVNHHNQLTPSTSSSSSSIMENEYPYIMGDTSVRYSSLPRTLLGKGASSIVCPGYHAGTNTQVAVKYIKEDHLRLDNKNMPMELKILRECNCVNIIRLVTSSRVENDGLYLALERGTMTLHEAISSNSVSRDHVIVWFKDTCVGVEYLHSNEIIHCDIKPSNIILVKTGDILVAKLSDFGLSKILSGTNLSSGTFTSGNGTYPYMAPETFKMPGQKFVVTKEGDIFSLGMTMYYAISNGQYPFPANTDREMEAHILNPKVGPKKLPNIYFAEQDLLWKMLEKERGNRPKIDEVLSHCLFWTLKMKRDYIVDVARSLECSQPDDLMVIVPIRDKIDIAYKKHFSKVSTQKGKFNWLKLLEKTSHRNLLLSSKSRPDTEKSYGNYDLISQLIKLFRDKRMHPADIKTEPNGTNAFTVNGTFNDDKYTHYFLQLCPGFVEVVYSVVRDNPLPFTKEYYIVNSGSTSSLSTPNSQEKTLVLSPVNVTGTATLLKGSSITIYEKDLISQNYFRGYSNGFLNPVAVYKVSLAQREHVKTATEKWKELASTRPGMNYLVPILSFAKSDESLYIATKLAKITLASELQLAQSNLVDHRHIIVDYLANVVSGITYLHENMAVHGKIDPDHILIFEERRKDAKLCLFTLDQPNDNEGLFQEMQNDLISFSNLLELSLSSSSNTQQSNGSKYVAAKDYTWNHLVRWIRESSFSVSPPTISQVANHPLFWDMQKSLHFIYFFWRTLTKNGKSQLDEQYAKLYKEREGMEFDWIPHVDSRLVMDSLAKSGSSISGLLCTISLGYENNKAIFKGESEYMEHFHEQFPDLLIICFCAALGKGYSPECFQNDIFQFVCNGQAKKEEVPLSEWMSIPPIFQNI